MQECGFYPRADALTASLDARTPAWKRPLWLWVKHLGAWPSSPEAVASAFDYDRAPFFQSFMEVRVEGSTNTVRFWLYGANGRLRWRDLHVQDDRIPERASRRRSRGVFVPAANRESLTSVWRITAGQSSHSLRRFASTLGFGVERLWRSVWHPR